MLPEQDRTELILRAAADLFALKGYRGTTMREIADALDVRAPSLYTYFPSKQDLLDQLATQTIHEGLEALRAGLGEGATIRERFLNGMERQVRYRLQHPTQMLSMTRSVEQLSASVQEHVLGMRSDYAAEWEGILREGIAAGEFDAIDPSVTALVLLDLCSYVQVKNLWIEQQRDADELVSLFNDLALKIVAPAA